MQNKFISHCILFSLLLFAGCSKEDNSPKSSTFVGEYSGTYSYASHVVYSTTEFSKYYGSPEWKSCAVTIKIEKMADNMLQMQCISASRSFDEIFSYSVLEDGTIDCKAEKANTTISIKNGKFSYFYYIDGWTEGVQPGTGRGYIERLSIQAFKK